MENLKKIAPESKQKELQDLINKIVQHAKAKEKAKENVETLTKQWYVWY